LVTFLVTALKEAAAALATIVVRKVIASRTARIHGRLFVATVTSKVTKAETAPSQRIGLVLSAPIVKKWATLRSAARSRLLPRMATLAVTVVVLVSLAMLEVTLLITPAVAATSAELLLVAIAGVEVAKLLLLVEAGRFRSLLDTTFLSIAIIRATDITSGFVRDCFFEGPFLCQLSYSMAVDHMSGGVSFFSFHTNGCELLACMRGEENTTEMTK
jgi:hypothetical protein